MDGGVQVDGGDTAVGGEACLSCLIRCFDLNFRPIDLLFRFIGIISTNAIRMSFVCQIVSTG